MSAPSRLYRYLLLALAAIGCVAVVSGAWKFASARSAEQARAEMIDKQQTVRSEIGMLEQRIAATNSRVAAILQDNAELSAALEKARAAAPLPPQPTLTRLQVEERIKQARQLATHGDPELALKELLWCWDHGVHALPRGVKTAQHSTLTSALAKLAESYPPAREQLLQRFEALRAQLRAGHDQDDAVSNFALVARALQQRDALLALYDELGPESPLRQSVGIYAYDQLVLTQRYRDAMQIRDYSSMSAAVERLNDSRFAIARSHTVKTIATNIEVLAGAGELVQARSLAVRLLNFESTGDTRALIGQHLARAGQAGLLEFAPK
jgi:hypothetical protein